MQKQEVKKHLEWQANLVLEYGIKQGKANRVLPREHTGHSKHTNTLFQQHKTRLYTWTSPDGEHQIRLIIFFAAKDREAPYSQQKQDWELTVAQIMNSLLLNSDLNWRK